MHTLTPTQRLKWRKRAVSVALNSAQNLLMPALNIMISALVIRLASRELWGQFVSALITAQLIAHVLAWGNKEYLLRHFSKHPNSIASAFQAVFIPRLTLFLAICPILLIVDGGILLILWIFPLFIAQSFEVMVVFRRHFAVAVILEMMLTVGMLGALLTSETITQNLLFTVFIVSAWVRGGVYAWRYRMNLILISPMDTIYRVPTSEMEKGEKHEIIPTASPLSKLERGFRGEVFINNLAYFRLALPFFLLGLSGMLASRIDLYTLSIMAEKSDVASYQVVINLLLYVQAGANFILIPFVKTLYRLDSHAIRKIAGRLFLFGCVAIPPLILLLRLLVGWVYELSYSDLFWVMGGLFALPIFGYLPLIHRLYGQNAQRFVLWVNIVGAVINGVLNVIFIPSMGITGALFASAICQWGMLGAYILRN